MLSVGSTVFSYLGDQPNGWRSNPVIVKVTKDSKPSSKELLESSKSDEILGAKLRFGGRNSLRRYRFDEATTRLMYVEF